VSVRGGLHVVPGFRTGELHIRLRERGLGSRELRLVWTRLRDWTRLRRRDVRVIRGACEVQVLFRHFGAMF
jgi:hypothetical protein